MSIVTHLVNYLLAAPSRCEDTIAIRSILIDRKGNVVTTKIGSAPAGMKALEEKIKDLVAQKN